MGIKISQLSFTTTLNDNDSHIVLQSGQNKQATTSTLYNYISSKAVSNATGTGVGKLLRADISGGLTVNELSATSIYTIGLAVTGDISSATGVTVSLPSDGSGGIIAVAADPAGRIAQSDTYNLTISSTPTFGQLTVTDVSTPGFCQGLQSPLVFTQGLPTIDPFIAGALWLNGTTIQMSAGS